MDLIDKKDGLPSVHAKGILSLLHHLFHVLLAGYSGIDLGKICAGGIGDDLGKGGLAGSRRSVKNNRSQLICLNCPVKQLILSYNVLLPYNFLQTGRTKPGSQRRLILHCLCFCIFK